LDPVTNFKPFQQSQNRVPSRFVHVVIVRVLRFASVMHAPKRRGNFLTAAPDWKERRVNVRFSVGRARGFEPPTPAPKEVNRTISP